MNPEETELDARAPIPALLGRGKVRGVVLGRVEAGIGRFAARLVEFGLCEVSGSRLVSVPRSRVYAGAVMAAVRIGTSGWMYDEWRHDFYAGVPRRGWLGHCAERFDAVEINATHYRLQRRSTFERWRDSVPEDFRFALKAHRYLTHVRRLRDPAEPIQRDRERAEVLGERLGAVLWQLPARFAYDDERSERLDRFLEAVVSGWPARHVLELRHRSWFRDDVAARLGDHDVSNCISHAADWPTWDAVTAELVYVRLHGHPRTYESEYGAHGLRPWTDRIEGWLAKGHEVYVFFDNDIGGAAPRDAQLLRRLIDGRRQA